MKRRFQVALPYTYLYFALYTGVSSPIEANKSHKNKNSLDKTHGQPNNLLDQLPHHMLIAGVLFICFIHTVSTWVSCCH